ncbi:hypothetical protein [Kribbella sp. NPDC051137]|uniref:hypothetical protein n=1 Tax=Kribbella sp. NPDC051137 TaxID=3155045 RepID=UPI00341E07E0
MLSSRSSKTVAMSASSGIRVGASFSGCTNRSNGRTASGLPSSATAIRVREASEPARRSDRYRSTWSSAFCRFRGWSAVRFEIRGCRRFRTSSSAVPTATTQSTPITGHTRPTYGSRNAGAVPPVPTLIAIGSSTTVSDTVTTSTAPLTKDRFLTPGA